MLKTACASVKKIVQILFFQKTKDMEESKETFYMV